MTHNYQKASKAPPAANIIPPNSTLPVGKAPFLELEVEPWDFEAAAAVVALVVASEDPDLVPGVVEAIGAAFPVAALLAMAAVALPNHQVSYRSWRCKKRPDVPVIAPGP